MWIKMGKRHLGYRSCSPLLERLNTEPPQESEKYIMMKLQKSLAAIAFSLFVTPFFVSSAGAHCDGLDGPVVIEAREALQSGKVDSVLKWVSEDEEAEIASAFTQALAASKGNAAAKELAETWFLETLVRIHREGEGAAYTGLKPSGQIDPAIQMADEALEKDSAESLARKIGGEVERQITERFQEATKRLATAAENPEEGREYVEAYVNYVHFIEGISNIMHHEGHGGEAH